MAFYFQRHYIIIKEACHDISTQADGQQVLVLGTVVHVNMYNRNKLLFSVD